MNQTLAVIVRAANKRGSYLNGLFYYGVKCCECETDIKELVHAHFLLNNSDCLTSTECIKWPDVKEVKALIEDDGISVSSCLIEIDVIDPEECESSEFALVKIPR
jgi:hypothetical protein